MANEYDNDELLRRLADESPDDGADDVGATDERERVWARVETASQPPRQPSGWRRRRLALAAVAGFAISAGLAVALFGSSGSGPGPARALAIEHGRNGVTLTITDERATAEEMNRELADAGIDRVRVISVPGSPNHAGTWGGMVNLMNDCDGGIRKIGFGVRIAYHPDSDLPAPGQNFVDLDLHQSREVAATVGLQSGAGKRAIVSEETIGNEAYAPTILIAIHPRRASEPDDAKRISADDLKAMGGVFAQFGSAMDDGPGKCSDFGLASSPPPMFPPADGNWTAIRIRPTDAGAREMTSELRAAGIHGRFVALPAQPQEAGGWLGFDRVPPFSPNAGAQGNRIDVTTGDPQHPSRSSVKVIALRTAAFQADEDARWRFYVGRTARPGEAPKIVAIDGVQNAAAALADHCKGSSRVSQPDGDRWCSSFLRAQVPVDPSG